MEKGKIQYHIRFGFGSTEHEKMNEMDVIDEIRRERKKVLVLKKKQRQNQDDEQAPRTE